LRRDALAASNGWDWSKGAFGHALSLPSRDDLHDIGKDHHHNLPYADLLRSCPYFLEIFEYFACPKASFRLLRRARNTAYGWHNDLNKGPGVVRFQVPIFSNEQSYLIVTDYDQCEQLKGIERKLPANETFATLDSFRERNEGHYEIRVLQPGLLYYFDTTKVHTLVNYGDEQRITLAMDLIANDWLRERYPQVRDEVSKSAPSP
jgi:hypothetical protein